MARPKGKKDSTKRKPRLARIAIQMIGKKFGRLVVQSIFSQGKDTKLNVICDCGTKKIVRQGCLKNGKVISCGCFHSEQLSLRQFKGENISAFNKVKATYKTSAKLRKLKFNLNDEDFKNLLTNNCFYCNQIPYMIVTTYSGSIKYNGIDRLDNSIGYEIENCVSCCKPCNIAKHNINKNMIYKLYHRLFPNE